MIISVDAGKSFDKIQHLFMIKNKTLRKLGIGRNFFNSIMNNYKEPTVNIILNGEKLDTFRKIRNKARMWPLTAPIQYHTRNPS